MKANVKYLIIIVAILISVSSFVTYSYFSANVESNNVNDVNVSSGKINVRIDDNSVNSIDVSPIYDADYEMLAYDKDFEVISDSSLNACSKISLHINEISDSLKSKYFKYRLVGEDIDVSGDFENAKEGEDIVLIDKLYLEKGTTKFLDLYIWISYQDGIDQSDMLSTKLNSNLVINAIDSKSEGFCK